MSETVKLVIEMPRRDYEEIKKVGVFTFPRVSKAIREATLLDDVKAEIEKLDEGITSYHNDKPWVYKSEVLEILDNIGKENDTWQD